MRVIIITQDDRFYIPKAVEYVLDNLPDAIDVCAVVVLSASPFGKKMSFLKRARQTIEVFGPAFFANYALRYFISRIGFGKTVAGLCQERSVDVLDSNNNINSEESLNVLRSYHPDLIISMGANQIFKPPLIELARHGCINVHSALLPRNRGLMPTFWALAHGDSETGVSVFFVDKGIDSGPIIIQKTIPITSRCLDLLLKETKFLGAQAVVEAIVQIRDEEIRLKLNDDASSTYNKFPTRDDVRRFREGGNIFF